jgi:hypothetical protein
MKAIKGMNVVWFIYSSEYKGVVDFVSYESKWAHIKWESELLSSSTQYRYINLTDDGHFVTNSIKPDVIKERERRLNTIGI